MTVIRCISIELPTEIVLRPQKSPDIGVYMYVDERNDPFQWSSFDLQSNNGSTLVEIRINQIAFEQIEFAKIMWRISEDRWGIFQSPKSSWEEKRVLQPLVQKEENK